MVYDRFWCGFRNGDFQKKEMIKQTHTYASLEVSENTYREIFIKLQMAGYSENILIDFSTGEEQIIMQGIALVPETKEK